MRDVRPVTTPPMPARGDADARSARPQPSAARLDEGIAELRATITRHVGQQRARGVALERVLADMQDLVRHAELLEGSPDELGVLLGQVHRWSLDAYLDQPEPRSAPRVY